MSLMKWFSMLQNARVTALTCRVIKGKRKWEEEVKLPPTPPKVWLMKAIFRATIIKTLRLILFKKYEYYSNNTLHEKKNKLTTNEVSNIKDGTPMLENEVAPENVTKKQRKI